MMSTGAEMPATVIVPSHCGSEWRRYRYPPPAMRAASTTIATIARRSHFSMRESYTVPRESNLKPVLDRLYDDFNYPDSAADPIQIVRRYECNDDREIVGFCAAALAFGRVASVLQSIERLLTIMGARPAAYVRRFDPRRHSGELSGFVHRWTTERDVVALLWVVRQMLDQAGSIE